VVAALVWTTVTFWRALEKGIARTSCGGHGEVDDVVGIIICFLSMSGRAAGVLGASGASDGGAGVDSLRIKASQWCQGVRLGERGTMV
jgi:hypothetical protein